MPGGRSTNFETGVVPKNLKELTTLCGKLEGSVNTQLDLLQKSNALELGQLREDLAKSNCPSGNNDVVNGPQFDARLVLAVAAIQAKLDIQIAAVRASLSQELTAARSEIGRLAEMCAHFADQHDAAEQYGRNNCLLVHGLTERPDENVMKTVVMFARDCLGIPLRE
jgi:hypothetical protein